MPLVARRVWNGNTRRLLKLVITVLLRCEAWNTKHPSYDFIDAPTLAAMSVVGAWANTQLNRTVLR